jgi:hypothetical protein
MVGKGRSKERSRWGGGESGLVFHERWGLIFLLFLLGSCETITHSSLLYWYESKYKSALFRIS